MPCRKQVELAMTISSPNDSTAAERDDPSSGRLAQIHDLEKTVSGILFNPELNRVCRSEICSTMQNRRAILRQHTVHPFWALAMRAA